MRVLNLDPDGYSPEASSLLREVANIDEGPLTRAALLERICDYDAIILRFAHRIDREVISAGRSLRAIAAAVTGTDHIDIEAAHARNITVVSLKGEAEFLRRIPASAEHSWGLLLALMRRIPWAAEAARRGEWTRDVFRGRDLAGRTLGIVGCGRIGERIARYASAFDMRVIAFDPHRTELPAGVERVESLMLLMAMADVIMLHAPLEPNTVKLINVTALAATRPGAVLVNTARGALIDEPALLAALASGQLAGAALDVLADEDSASVVKNPLVAFANTHDNLILTPHIGGATYDSMAATEIFIARKLRQVLQAHALIKMQATQ